MGVLDGIRVLDLTRFLAGPWCGAILADMGAEVIRIDRPGGEEDRKLGPLVPGEGDSVMFINPGRNKKGITLNLRSEKGKEIFRKLVRISDVVLENFPSGIKEDLGLDYETLSKVNPRIICASVTGFGRRGPYSRKVAFDPVAQAMSGIMSYNGFPDNPPTRASFPAIDVCAALYTTIGIVLALYHREKTGEGQEVDISLLDTAVAFVANHGAPAAHILFGEERGRLGNYSWYNFSNLVRTKDGWIYLSGVSDPIFKRLLKVIGKEELIDELKGDMNRFEKREMINEMIEEWSKNKTTEEALRELEASRIPCGKFNTIPEMMKDPQVMGRDMLVYVEYDAGKVPISGNPVKLSKTPPEVKRRAPRVGENNREIYCGLLGMKEEELDELKREGII